MSIAKLPNRQVHAMACRVEIADRGGDANAVATIARPRPHAGRSWIVLVPDLRIAERAAGVVEGVIDRLPGVGARPFDPNGAVGAVKIALRVAIVFELAIIRQDLREAPLRVAPRGPFVEVFRC